MKLSVIMPTYNEEDFLAEILDCVQKAKLPEGMTREIIIINDGSTDKTAEIAEKYADGKNIKLFHQKNQGKAAGVLKGFAEATGDIFLIQDADLEYSPDDYFDLLTPIVEGKYQVVYGSRFMGSFKGMKKRIRLANFMTNLTLNVIFGTKMTDNNTCFKVFKREVLDDIIIKTSHYGFDTEVTCKILKKKIPIHEIPIQYVPRTKEEGKKITFVTSFGSYLQIFKYSFVD